MTNSSGIPPRDAMLGLLSGYWYSATLHAAARLGVADLVADGPLSVAEIARLTGAHEPSLHRLLSALANTGIFRETAPGFFAQNEMSETLRDTPGSLRTMAVLGCDPSHWDSWGKLLQGVRSGDTPFLLAHGERFFSFLERSEDTRRLYDAVWDASGDVILSITAAYDFSGFRTIVDVGGGRGDLLRSVLEKAPNARGVLFDRPAVVTEAPEMDRIERVGGDFFESVPADGDLYILKFVLHDWPDDRAAEILARCADAMGDDGRLLIAELLLPEDSVPSGSRIDDLNMFVLTGGRARAEGDFRDLLAAAGLRLEHIIPTSTEVRLLEAVRRPGDIGG